MFDPNFNPEKVKRYLRESRGQGDPGSVFVLLHDFLDLLEMYYSSQHDAWSRGYLAAIDDWDEKGDFAIPQIPENGQEGGK